MSPANMLKARSIGGLPCGSPPLPVAARAMGEGSETTISCRVPAMTKPSIRRIVIACDAVCELGPAIEVGAAIAAHWRASLHGLFIEDPALLQAAALPFT